MNQSALSQKAQEIKDKTLITTDRLNKKLAAYQEYSQNVTSNLIDSYTQNIDVVIDMTNLLATYNSMFDEIIANFGKFDSVLSDKDFQALRAATSAKINQLKEKHMELTAKLQGLKIEDPRMKGSLQGIQNVADASAVGGKRKAPRKPRRKA